MIIDFPSMSQWVYNLQDYRQIFALTDVDLSKKILQLPGGISSVNAELYALGHTIVSADPLYYLPAHEMAIESEKILQATEAQLRGQLADPSKIFTAWRFSKEQFLADYAVGKAQNRYVELDLHKLSIADQKFDLVLCSDLLFSNHSSISTESILEELTRLALEVRIFPLSNEQGELSAGVGPIMLAFQQRNYGVEVRAIQHEERRRGEAMLRLWAKECVV